MATAHPTFDGAIRWQGGGCLVCGSNISRPGEAVGVQAVSLDVEDEVTGETLGLCYTHAVEVGRTAGMVNRETVAEAASQVSDLLAEAQAAQEAARADASQARLDKDTIERLLGPIYNEAPAEVGA